MSFIPNLFHKDPIPKDLPKDMQRVINKLKKTKSKEECLHKAYDILSRKYRGYRFFTYLKFFNAFDNLNQIWKRRGFLHCHHFTFLMRVLLVRSGKFKESDIKYMNTLVWYFSLHQYLRVRIGKRKFINVDLWGKYHDIKFGDYAHGFH